MRCMQGTTPQSRVVPCITALPMHPAPHSNQSNPPREYELDAAEKGE